MHVRRVTVGRDDSAVASAVAATDRAARDALRADDTRDFYQQFLDELSIPRRPMTPLAFARQWGEYTCRSFRPDLTPSDRTTAFGVFSVMRGIRVAVLRILRGADDAPECRLAEQRLDAIFYPPTPPATPQIGQAEANRVDEMPAFDLPPLSDAAPLPLDEAVRGALSGLVSALLPMFDD